MIINNEIFKGYLNCKYKAYLKLIGNSGNRPEYEAMQHDIGVLYKKDALKKVLSAYKEKEILNNQNLSFAIKDGKKAIVNANISSDGLQTYCDFMERVSGKSGLGAFHYVPVLFVGKEKFSEEDKLMMAYNGLVIGKIQNREPGYGKIVYGRQFKTSKVRLDGKWDIITKSINDLKEYGANGKSPQLILNRHCQICEFKNLCRVKAIEKDDLSLLYGISTKEIEAQNKKGIFTVTQYSYTFRPRKKFRKAYPFNLKALALREQKVHLYGTPVIPTSGVQIYMDVEGDPERDFYYLIGMVIVENGVETQHSFWADSKAEEGAACLAFVNHIRKYGNYKLYHYGSYETKFLKKIQSYLYDADDIQVIEGLIANAVNVLSIVYEHVFFPTYSNGLKDVGAFLGFKWTSNSASGINSLVWRVRFEETMDDNFKRRLLKYNLDDCLALKRVTEFVNQIIYDITAKGLSHVDYIRADALKVKSQNRWGRVDFVIKDMERINDCAYFDYQREKVFVRTDKRFKETNKRRTKRLYHRVNKEVVIKVPTKCPICRARLNKNRDFSRTVFDLKFTGSGVRRELTSYITGQMRCFRCTTVTTPDEYKTINRYGHGLISFVVYYLIEWHMPYIRIEKMLFDLFGFSKIKAGKRIKDMAVEYYRATSQQICERILHGKFIHIDETKVNVGKISGYVWVLSNMEDVYFLYTPTREGDFLREMLADYKGVIISDFYGAYCYPKWIQQKCLVHLIRDLNDDLISAPFDEEYKKITEDFTILLRKMIDTIDKFGLKRRHLAKHKKETIRFFRDIGRPSFRSELAQKYQRRFLKNENTLFTFLDYDGVPWNNNNAEHAIKHFAVYRNGMERIGGLINEEGLKSHLALLSIYQSCRYRGINFLKFLVSKEKDINKYSTGQ